MFVPAVPVAVAANSTAGCVTPTAVAISRLDEMVAATTPLELPGCFCRCCSKVADCCAARPAAAATLLVVTLSSGTLLSLQDQLVREL